MIQGRPATAADVAMFYPDAPCSFRAWVCELDGEPEGIIGIALLSPVACLFSAFRDGLRPHLKHPAVLRLIKQAQAAVRDCRSPVWAIAQDDEPTSPKILTRLGFQRLGVLEGAEVYEFTGG